MVFQQKLSEKAGLAMVRLASSDKWKAPYVYLLPHIWFSTFTLFFIMIKSHNYGSCLY